MVVCVGLHPPPGWLVVLWLCGASPTTRMIGGSVVVCVASTTTRLIGGIVVVCGAPPTTRMVGGTAVVCSAPPPTRMVGGTVVVSGTVGEWCSTIIEELIFYTILLT